jgi:predicted DNA-binding transcriptional regulator AlpA
VVNRQKQQSLGPEVTLAAEYGFSALSADQPAPKVAVHTLATNPLLDATAVAALLRISRAAAYREMKKMQHEVIGERSVRVTEAAVEAYVRQHER